MTDKKSSRRTVRWPLPRDHVARGFARSAALTPETVDWEGVPCPLVHLPGGLGVRYLAADPRFVEVDSLSTDHPSSPPPLLRLGPAPLPQRGVVWTEEGPYEVVLEEDCVAVTHEDEEPWPDWTPPTLSLAAPLPDPLALVGSAPVEAWLREALDPPRQGPLQQVAALALVARYGQAAEQPSPDQAARAALARLTEGDVQLLSRLALASLEALTDEVQAWTLPPPLSEVQALAHQAEDLAGVLALARAAAPGISEVALFWRALLDLEREISHQASLLPPIGALADDERLVSAAELDPEAWWAPLTWS